MTYIVVDFVLVSLLLNLNIYHIFFSVSIVDSMTSFSLNIFHMFFNCIIVDFEQVNVRFYKMFFKKIFQIAGI